MKLPKKLKEKLDQRHANNALRELPVQHSLIDFSSNDYLGFAKSEAIFDKTHQYLSENGFKINGSSGSRLLSGNHSLYETLEIELANNHNSASALILNSGYSANLGFLGAIGQRNDIILYDELVHHSIRAGIKNSYAKSYKFKHNNLRHLEERLNQVTTEDTTVYVVTESVFSMDGDSPKLEALVSLCKSHNAYVIIDEAHALGVFNMGLVQAACLEKEVFARVITFGKALGCHGAVVLGSEDLKHYLVNFSASFIYTTALPPHSLAAIKMAYKTLKTTNEVEKLQDNIAYFKSKIEALHLQNRFIESVSAIQCCIVSGNNKVKHLSQQLQNKGFNIKPILSPTVPEHQERLRFCLHSYNSKDEISQVLELLATFG